jgi:hypothetical protein
MTKWIGTKWIGWHIFAIFLTMFRFNFGGEVSVEVADAERVPDSPSSPSKRQAILHTTPVKHYFNDNQFIPVVIRGRTYGLVNQQHPQFLKSNVAVFMSGFN